MKRGADVDIKDANGISPFDWCLEMYSPNDIRYIISKTAQWKDIILSDNKTKLIDIVPRMSSSQVLSKFLANYESIADLTVPNDSPLWPGYTILHLAIVLSERKSTFRKSVYWFADERHKIEQCLNRGIKITQKDANNRTALHLAFHLQKSRIVELLLEHDPATENPSNDFGLSHFHIACAAQHENAVEKFLLNGVDINVAVTSTVKWHTICENQPRFPGFARQEVTTPPKSRYFFLVPGSTALHFNAASGNSRITKMLLDHGTDIYAKDVNGFTPVHRLFTSRNDSLVADLLLNLEGLQDRKTVGGLTHLHVACHHDNVSAIRKLLDSGADIDARVTYKNKIDRYFDAYDDDPTKDPLSIISSYTDYTPLNFAMHSCSIESKRILVTRGANVFARNLHRYNEEPIYRLLDESCYYSEALVSNLLKNEVYKDRLDTEFGIKLLHIACYAHEVELARKLLVENGEDANMKVRDDSRIWPGCTPLHLVMANTSSCADQVGEARELIRLLLEYGADVTVKNGEDDTPLHVCSAMSDGQFDDIFSVNADLLLEAVKNFAVNPVNSQGVSFFHIACIKKDLSIVEEYLKQGVDVNQAVGHFSNRYSGCVPLHLVAGYFADSPDDSRAQNQLKIIELLLKYGADLRVSDTCGNTVLHEVGKKESLRQVLSEKIIRNGADVNAVNIRGETALEILMESETATWEEINCFINNGCSINSFNPITEVGYITHRLLRTLAKESRALADPVIRNLIDLQYIGQIDEMGRSFLHNVVSATRVHIEDYEELIEQLMNCGLNVDHQDKRGRTALHAASLCKNSRGIVGLLKNGADMNITDEDGYTPFYYAFQSSQFFNAAEFLENRRNPHRLITPFTTHVLKMETCRMPVNELNLRLHERAMTMCGIDRDAIARFEESLEKAKNLKIVSTGLTLYEFCFEMKVEMVYPHMPVAERLEIDTFFKDLHQLNLHELNCLLKLKYKNALERLRLIDPAMINDNLIEHQLPKLNLNF